MRLIPRAIIGLAAALLFFAAVPARSEAQDLSSLGSLSGLLSLLTSFAPPVLPAYDQPPAPGPNHIWQPGYWAAGPAGYFWVPGTWVTPPQPNLLWTPGYWAANPGGQYRWIPGYWARNVGYYGDIDYGNGYNGSGYDGGRWQNNTFYYNTAVTNVNRSVVRFVYSERGRGEYNDSHVSYNGGRGGIHARPDQHQIAWGRERHYAMTAAQQEHVRIAEQDRNDLQSVNHGRPQHVSVQRPLAANNRPPGFTPVRPSDRAFASARRPTLYRATPMRQAPKQQAHPIHPQARRVQPAHDRIPNRPAQHVMRAKGGAHQARPHGHSSPHPGR